MRSSSRDAIFVSINLAVFCCFGWMLYADFGQRIEKTDGVRLGTITFKKRVAERKYSDQVIWETITEKTEEELQAYRLQNLAKDFVEAALSDGHSAAEIRAAVEEMIAGKKLEETTKTERNE